jgi:hypothetical protein
MLSTMGFWAAERRIRFAPDQLTFLVLNAFKKIMYLGWCVASKTLDASIELTENLPCCGAQKEFRCVLMKNLFHRAIVHS